MTIAVSIEPYLGGETTKLTQYLDEIVALREKVPGLSVHFDYFVARPAVVEIVRQYAQKIPVDVHLMNQELGGLAFRSVARDVRTVTAAEINDQTGLVFDLGVDVVGYEELVRRVHYVTVMSVKCGRSGQTFNPAALAVVKKIRALNPGVILTVDGGVNDGNIRDVYAAGADIAVVGNYAKTAYENGNLFGGLNRLLHD